VDKYNPTLSGLKVNDIYGRPISLTDYFLLSKRGDSNTILKSSFKGTLYEDGVRFYFYSHSLSKDISSVSDCNILAVEEIHSDSPFQGYGYANGRMGLAPVGEDEFDTSLNLLQILLSHKAIERMIFAIFIDFDT
jgi:hypothetical protein